MACYFFSDLINRSYIDDKGSSKFLLIETFINMVRRELEDSKKYTLEALQKKLKTYRICLNSYGLFLQNCGDDTDDYYKKSEYKYNSQILLDQAEYLKRIIEIIDYEPLEVKNKLEQSRNKITEIRQHIREKQNLTKKLNDDILKFKQFKDSLIINANWCTRR